MGELDRAAAADLLVAAALSAVEDLSIVIFDCDMRITAVLGGAAARHGYVPERLVGRRAPDVLPAPAWEALGPLYAQVLAGEAVDVERRSQDGRAIYATTFRPVHRDGVLVGAMATSRDVTAQREAEEALLRSEREFRQLAESSTDMITRTAPDGTVLYVSPAVRTVADMGPDEFREMGGRWGRMHPLDREAVAAVRGEVMADGLARSVSFRMLRADGSQAWLECDLRVVRDERTGEVAEVHGATRDVTARKVAETAERLAIARFEQSFTEAPVGMALLTHGRIARANRTLAEALDVEIAELVGQDPVGLVHPRDRDRMAATIAMLAVGEPPPPQDLDVVTRDGRRRSLRARFSLLPGEEVRTVLMHVVDRSAEVAADRARETALAAFETSFTQAPIGMCLVSTEGRFLRVNPALCLLFARSEDELLRCDFQQLTHPEDLAADLAEMQQTLDGVRSAYEIDKRYLRPDGNVIDARLSVSLVRDREGRPDHFISQIVDLTALQHARRALGEAGSRLKAFVDNSPTAVYLRDLDQRWQIVNPETCRILGLPEDRLIGRTMRETLDPETAEHLAGHDAQVLAAGRAMTFDETAPDARTGQIHHWWSAKFPVRDPGGAIVGLGGMSLDVTDRERAVRELAVARELFETAFTTASVGMLITRVGEDGVPVAIECNEALAQMIGRRPEDILGSSGASLVVEEDLPERARLIDELTAGRAASGELRLRHADGHAVWVQVAPALVTDTDGARLFLLQAIDISERKQFEGRLQHLVDHDPLTGLLSRRRFETELEREVARTHRHGGPACLLLLDLDGFKAVNDLFGHSTGDALLTRIGRALEQAVREVDLVARLGGDEFAIVLTQTDAAGGRAVATKLVEVVRENGRVARNGRHAAVTASIGITSLTGPGARGAEGLLSEADTAMYQAKGAGKDRIAVFEAHGAHGDEELRRTDWVERLRCAMRDDRLVLHAQPVVAVAGAADPGEHLELLLRMRDERGELVAPGTFVHHAERDGLIVDIDRWVLGQAVALLHAAQRAGRDLSLAINFSARTVQDPQIVGDLEALLARHPIRPRSLLIEVTETAAISDVTRAAEFARQVRRLGCLLALDDFGAGYASFFHLKHLIFDVLKIDGDFIDRLPTSATDQLVVRAVVDIARGLGVRVVAERVGDQDTLDLLGHLGVDFGQGFFLGRPVPLAERGL